MKHILLLLNLVLFVLTYVLLPIDNVTHVHLPHDRQTPNLLAKMELGYQKKDPIIKDHWYYDSSLGGVSEERINTVLGILQAKGLTRQGAAMLTGNFITESKLQPCDSIRGDGGLAWGLAQWHPGRRQDMPCDLEAQLHWAIDTEMQRDTPALKAALYDNSKTAYDLDVLLYKWERYGVKGNRYEYGLDILAKM